MTLEKTNDVAAIVEAPPGVTAAAGSPMPPSSGGFRRFLKRFLAQRTPTIALGMLALVVLAAVFAPILAPHDPEVTDLSNVLADPGDSGLLGTDDLGRDVLSRLLFAVRISLLAAVQAVLVSIVLGVPPGLIAGYYGGRIDALVMRITDAVMSFPFLILAIAIVGVLGPSLTNAMFAVGFVFAPRLLRLVRATAAGIREETYIEASKSIGTPARSIIWRHVVPNSLPPLIVQVSLLAGFAMLAEASLSFLGLGVQAPDTSLGSMLQRGIPHLNRAPTLVIFPGVVISLLVLLFNVVGDGLRDSLGREVRRE